MAKCVREKSGSYGLKGACIKPFKIWGYSVNLPDIIKITWHIDDIKQQDPSLTDDQCRDILQLIVKKHDANIGINWDFIDAIIEYYKELDNE